MLVLGLLYLILLVVSAIISILSIIGLIVGIVLLVLSDKYKKSDSISNNQQWKFLRTLGIIFISVGVVVILLNFVFGINLNLIWGALR